MRGPPLSTIFFSWHTRWTHIFWPAPFGAHVWQKKDHQVALYPTSLDSPFWRIKIIGLVCFCTFVDKNLARNLCEFNNTYMYTVCVIASYRVLSTKFTRFTLHVYGHISQKENLYSLLGWVLDFTINCFLLFVLSQSFKIVLNQSLCIFRIVGFWK